MELCQYPCRCRIRCFTIEAIQIPIVYNRYGDYDPNGLLYVLEEDAERIQEEAARRFSQMPPEPYEEVRPLVLRVNLGDTVKVCFHNRLHRRLSIHVQGLSYDVKASDGTSTGFNPDSTTSDEIVYTWYADTEGVFLFHDMADARSSEDATNIHGLFGAVIVEPPGARWFDPQTGEEMKSGLMADIYQPGKPAFREYTVFFHDELEILNRDGKPPIDHRTGLPASTTAISYRSEPMRNRMPLNHEPEDSGEEISMSSWVYGDPAPPILRAYVGDPAKIRLIHGGIKETHVFHLHNRRRKRHFIRVTRILSVERQGCLRVSRRAAFWIRKAMMWNIRHLWKRQILWRTQLAERSIQTPVLVIQRENAAIRMCAGRIRYVRTRTARNTVQSI